MLTGQPVPGAFVHLRGKAIGVYTAADGRYRLFALPGEWELMVDGTGYLSMYQTHLRILAGQALTVDFGLVLSDPDPWQHDLLFHALVTPPEQAGADGPMVSDISAAAVPSTIRVLMPDGHVVETNLDEYLKGVVPSELPPYAPMEALKAQAVAARSYAITSWNHAAEGANVCTTTHCQAWKNIRFSRTDQAVTATSGMVATHSGRTIRAFYFGHCDGHTRNSEDVWIQALPYCRSVVCVCGFDRMWGHGVGMCQEGAMEMAERGATFDEILRHYYTGVSVAGLQPTPTPTPTLTPTPTPSPQAAMTYSLASGWNLFSFPVMLDDPKVTSVFAPIAGKYDMVMQWDAFASYARWKVFDPKAPTQYGGLEAIDPRYGIWLRATEPCALTVSGQRLLTTTVTPLNTGLNLIGYLSMQTRPITEALSSIEGKYVRVYTYQTLLEPSPWLLFDFTVPAGANTLTAMKPGAAYWIQVITPCTWNLEP